MLKICFYSFMSINFIKATKFELFLAKINHLARKYVDFKVNL